MWRTDSLEKIPMLGKTEGRRRRGQQMMWWLDGTTDSVEWVWGISGSWWWTGKPDMLESMGSQRVRHDWVTELNWIDYLSLQKDTLKSQSPVPQNVTLFRKKVFVDAISEDEAIWSTVKVKVTQSCLTLCDPMDYAVHGILQARELEWVVIPFSRGSSQSRCAPNSVWLLSL